MTERQRGLAAIIDAAAHRPLGGPPTPRPAVSAGPAPAAMWGPSFPRAVSPLQLLVKVANNAHSLNQKVNDLVEAVTGSPPQLRGRAVDKLPASLLPAISTLAHEIEQVHAQIGQAVHHLRSQL